MKKKGGQIESELISIDRDILLPAPPGIKPVVRISKGDPTKMLALLIIYLVYQDLKEVSISIPSIPWRE